MQLNVLQATGDRDVYLDQHISREHLKSCRRVVQWLRPSHNALVVVDASTIGDRYSSDHVLR